MSDGPGSDSGLRFVDLDEDGQLDVLFSNDDGYGVYLFDVDGRRAGRARSWRGKRGDPDADAADRASRATNNGVGSSTGTSGGRTRTPRLPDLSTAGRSTTC